MNGESKVGMNHMQRMRALEEVADLVRPDHVAGATVLRKISIGSRTFNRGEFLTPEQLLAIPVANFSAMVTNHFISLKLGPIN